MSTIKSRLARLEKATGEFSDILALIGAGRYFDELTPEQQRRYCIYRFGTDQHPEANICRVFEYPFDAHFKLEAKPKPPTRAEFLERVAEVEQMMREATEAYISDSAGALERPLGE